MMNMVQLIDLLRVEIGPCPPGPERERRKKEVAERYLAKSTTEAERLFWSTFRDHVGQEPQPTPAKDLCIRCGKVKPPEHATAHDDLKPYCGIECAMLDGGAQPPEPPVRGPILLGPIPAKPETWHCRKCGASSVDTPEDSDCNPMSIGPQDHTWVSDRPESP